MDWSQSVIIPAESVRRAERLGLILRAVLWTASHALYFIAAIAALFAWLIWRWRIRKTKRVIT